MPRTMTPYTSRKLRNDLLRLNPNLDVRIKPATVNGAVFGCSGFVSDPSNGAIVYVSTDHNHGTRYDQALYRTAKSLRDYTGGRNNQCSYSELAQNVVSLLRKRPAAGNAASQNPPVPQRQPASQGRAAASGLRREYALVHSILPKGRTPNGGVIWELDLGGGRKVRTAAGSGSWASRMDPRPGRVQRLCLLFNGRGTVSGVARD